MALSSVSVCSSKKNRNSELWILGVLGGLVDYRVYHSIESSWGPRRMDISVESSTELRGTRIYKIHASALLSFLAVESSMSNVTPANYKTFPDAVYPFSDANGLFIAPFKLEATLTYLIFPQRFNGLLT
jgi:hypothetical protein